MPRQDLAGAVFFSATYAQARRRFLEAARERSAAVDSHRHSRQGAEGEELALDTALLGPADASPTRRRRGAVAVVVLVAAVVIAAWWFYPVWTGQLIGYDQWQQRMWLPSWV